MKNFKPLDEKEMDAVWEVCKIFKSQNLIPCTACKYCIEHCPQSIPIPELFACLNSKRTLPSWNQNYYYGVLTSENTKASSCIGCANCENACPQHIEIRNLLKEVAEEFEK